MDKLLVRRSPPTFYNMWPCSEQPTSRHLLIGTVCGSFGTYSCCPCPSFLSQNCSTAWDPAGSPRGPMLSPLGRKVWDRFHAFGCEVWAGAPCLSCFASPELQLPGSISSSKVMEGALQCKRSQAVSSSRSQRSSLMNSLQTICDPIVKSL